MQIKIKEFDAGKIAESGQCFRMVMTEDGSYDVIFRNNYLNIKPVCYNEITGESILEFDCSEAEYNEIWREYFDLDTDYSKIVSMVDKEDKFLNEAVNYGRGMRILRQDPWEMLISFIISQRKSIPAIRTSIERLCKMCDEKIETAHGIKYLFPDAGTIAKLSIDELASCGLGYRARYISETAKKVASGEFNVYALEELADNELREALMSLCGVGVKVADCVMLFGYRRLSAFPEDVWIKRAMETEYPNGFPFDKYQGYSGIMQQYIFFYIRNRN